MANRVKYVILFVSNMDDSVQFFRDILGLTLKFQSPFWSEFNTGETSLAIHPASEKNPAGKVQIGLDVGDVQTFYDEMVMKGVKFTQPPTKEAGSLLARFLSPDGTEISIGSN
jgi:catechol 2,3-dioxygenase-like lactoylglutathione lyase family enzyme